jgi:hypothetical protein
MATNTNAGTMAPSPPPTLHEAERVPGTSGIVWWGAEIDAVTAIARGRSSEDVVVRGDNLEANRTLAQQIEGSVGPYRRCIPHVGKAGPNALPHFQQVDPNHAGHCSADNQPKSEFDEKAERQRVLACGLTEAEADCWIAVANAAGKFFELPKLHPMDDHEVSHAIHVVQHKLLSRPVYRCYKELAKGEKK